MTNNCVCCGAEIPEGRQVCSACEKRADGASRGDRRDLLGDCRAIADRPDEPAPNHKEFVLVCSGCGLRCDVDTTWAGVDEAINSGWRSAGRGRFYCHKCVSELPVIEDLSMSRCELYETCMSIADRSGIDRAKVRAKSAECEAFVPDAGTDRITFTVPGQPFGKQRPRVAGRIAYTPRETKAHEQQVIGAYFAQTDKRKFLRPEIRIKAFYGVPASASKKKQAAMLAGAIRPQVKPDLDNVAKLVMDALDEIAYEDDKDVVFLSVEKFYSDDPRLEVEIREAEA